MKRRNCGRLAFALCCGIGMMGGQGALGEASGQPGFNTLLEQHGWASKYDAEGNLFLYRLQEDATDVPDAGQSVNKAAAIKMDGAARPPQADLVQLIARLQQAGWQVEEDGKGGLLLHSPKNGGNKRPLHALIDTRPDTDYDGVADELDLCLDSGKREPVNLVGCSVGEPLPLQGVGFRSGSSRLTNTAKRDLNSRVAILQRHPELRLTVLGHTDSVGRSDSNMRLSQRRAEAVRSYLITQGLAEKRITAQGRGESSPVADNATTEGRRKNRRVELLISPGD